LPAAEAGGGDKVLEHRHVAERLRHLVAAADAEAAALMRLQLRDVAAVVVHAALVAAHVARHEVEERRLARAVGTQDAERLARANFERDVIGDAQRTIRLADRAQREQGRGHGLFDPAVRPSGASCRPRE
jgi:hypothetical protein